MTDHKTIRLGNLPKTLTAQQGEAPKVSKNWDRGLDFPRVKRKLDRLLRKTPRKTTRSSLSCLYVQLLNGSRVSEAVSAYNQFLETGKREVDVRVRKQRGENTRRMVIPPQVRRNGLPRTVGGVKTYASSLTVGGVRVNSHSLRYAFVGHLSAQGVSAQMIAKITGHRKLDTILKYCQQKRADELLDEIAGGATDAG